MMLLLLLGRRARAWWAVVVVVVVVAPWAGAVAVRMAPAAGETVRPRTYSNPLGATLTPVREDVWLAERPFYPRVPGLQGVDVGCKAAVVRLGDGTLWVHAPVDLDVETRAAVDALGPVRHVVTPNTEHLKFAGQWLQAYPDATGFACPGLQEKRPDIGYAATVGADASGAFTTACPEAWLDEFEVCWLDAERSPFKVLGDKPFFSEVVFLHKPSKVLFITDLWWNYPSAGAPRLWKFGMDAIYRPVYNGLMRQPRDVHDERVRRILAWDFDYIAPCHGDPVAGPDVKKILANHLNFSPPPP